MDDYCPKRGFLGEHGLSLHIETPASKILLDTGQTDAFIANAELMGIDLSSLNAVILSHGHYDHGGGLEALYKRLSACPPPFFAGRDFDAPRSVKQGDQLKDIGLPSRGLSSHLPVPILIDVLERFDKNACIIPSAEAIDVTGTSAPFLIIKSGIEKLDTFADELSLVFDEGDGIVIVTGCAHRGILNITYAAMKVFPGKPIKALVGGFHLVDKAESELAKISEAIAALEPEAVFCAHCTSPRGFSALLNSMPGKVKWLTCGMNVSI